MELGETEKGREKRETFHSLVHSPRLLKHPELGHTKAWDSIWVSHMGGKGLGTYALVTHDLSRCIREELDQKSSSHDLNWNSDMGC